MGPETIMIGGPEWARMDRGRPGWAEVYSIVAAFLRVFRHTAALNVDSVCAQAMRRSFVSVPVNGCPDPFAVLVSAYS